MQRFKKQAQDATAMVMSAGSANEPPPGGKNHQEFIERLRRQRQEEADDLDDLFLTELDMQNPSLDFVDSMKDEINPFHNQDTSIDSGHRISISTPGSAERKIIQSEAMSQFVKNINSNSNTPQP